MFGVRNIDTVIYFHLLFGHVSMLRTLTFLLTKVINFLFKSEQDNSCFNFNLNEDILLGGYT